MIREIIRSIYLNKKNKKRADFRPKNFFESTKRTFRVGFRDIDFNMHINNARYMVFMERARWDHPVQTASWDKMLGSKLNFIVAGIEMGYIREIRLFKTFDVETRYVGWDDKYFYIEQRFVADGKIHAYGLVKAVFMQRGKLASPSAVATQLNIGSPEEPLPEHMEQWQKMSIAKRAYSDNPNLASVKQEKDLLKKSA
ncbi:MAG: thioesterase family protein [Saccharospirillaceae bacterium]|nr:integrase [Thalassolituus sp. HI0120]MCH2040343.1 thioesterase family protein [Saccharospirillaceae bacterium]